MTGQIHAVDELLADIDTWALAESLGVVTSLAFTVQP